MRQRNEAFHAVCVLFALALANCASEPTVPYPAFVKVPELPDSFVASLPGIRAKQLAGNMETRQSSQLLTLPSGWEFTTGGLPDKSVEIYVIVGSIRLGGIDMPAGGYAYLPSGTSGVPITTDGKSRAHGASGSSMAMLTCRIESLLRRVR